MEAQKIIFNKKDLIDALKEFDDNDAVVVEVHDAELGEDLYYFTIDVIEGIKMEDGTTIREIRICPVEHENLPELMKHESNKL